jgi:hypothetical protein
MLLAASNTVSIARSQQVGVNVSDDAGKLLADLNWTPIGCGSLPNLHQCTYS